MLQREFNKINKKKFTYELTNSLLQPNYSLSIVPEIMCCAAAHKLGGDADRFIFMFKEITELQSLTTKNHLIMHNGYNTFFIQHTTLENTKLKSRASVENIECYVFIKGVEELTTGYTCTDEEIIFYADPTKTDTVIIRFDNDKNMFGTKAILLS